MHILIIDDDKDDIAFMKELIPNSSDVSISEAHEGQEALELVLGDRLGSNPDLIILDINMPIMNGFEFLKEKAKLQAIKNIPVIILSSSKSQKDIDQSYELGANCFIIKPSGLREFQKLINSIISFWVLQVKYPTILK